MFCAGVPAQWVVVTENAGEVEGFHHGGKIGLGGIMKAGSATKWSDRSLGMLDRSLRVAALPAFILV